MTWEWEILRPDAVTVWMDNRVRDRLSWYYAVMKNLAPAKYRICKRIEAPKDPWSINDLEELWSIHEDLAKEFDDVYRDIREGRMGIEELSQPKHSFLDVKARIAWLTIEECTLCERRCKVNRKKGEKGACGLDYRVYVHSWFHHYGEEAPLVPSGTIFYGGCNLKCVYCQNHDISQENPTGGIEVDAKELALMQKELRRTGARNINHVGGDPTPSLHVILESLLYLDVNVPQLWNSNMYCTAETMKLLREVIDIWLPDLKYGNNECARRLSLVDKYWETATRNIKWAHDWSDIIVRHLVLPNHIECCTKPVLKWLAENCPRALVNIMEQYRPEFLVARMPEKWPDIARRPTLKEMREAYRYAKELGIVYEPVS